MQLDEFYAYKNQFMKDILTTDSIVKLIDETVPLENARSLVYENVFPYEYIPETVTDAKTFVCIDVDIQKDISSTALVPIIIIWVFAHKSKLILPNGEGVRTDKLCNEICKKINGSRFYGLTPLDIRSVKRFAPINDYNGKVMVFYTREVNRYYDPKRELPVNRRNQN